MKKVFAVIVSIILYSMFSDAVYASDTELFADPKFQNGVAVGYANTYPDSDDQACINRWKNIISDYTNTKWTFIEISERFYFCDNQTNNPSINSNLIQYVSPNAGMKKFTSNRNGLAHFEFDSSWEWRGGCNLSKQWDIATPSSPKYGNSVTNWPHFLVSQLLSPSYIPSQYDSSNPNIIPLSERVNLSKYSKIQFTGQFRLNNLEKIGTSQCPSTDWSSPDVPNHAIFYIAFVLWHNTWNFPRIQNVPNVIYQLLPIVYSNDGTMNIGGQTSYVMGDQFGDRTYLAKLGEGVTTNAKKLTEGSTTFETINIDVGAFSRQVLTEINPNLNPSDYFVAAFLAGWEIWGGYKTDVEMKDLSLKGFGGPTNTPTPTQTPPSPTAPAGKPGDLTGDGKVDSADFNKIKNEFGRPYTIFDYNVLLGNFGK